MKTLSLGPQIVWSDGANSLYHPLMAGAPSHDYAHGRFHLEVRNRTVNAKVRVVGQYSDDGISWTDSWAVLISGWTQANGLTYGTTWVDIPAQAATVRAFFRLGVECGGTTAGQNEICIVALRADIKDT